MIYNKDNIEGLQFTCGNSPIIYTINKKDEAHMILTWISPGRGITSDVYSKDAVLRKLNYNHWNPINVNYEIY